MGSGAGGTRCCTVDGSRPCGATKAYSSGKFGNCPPVAPYRTAVWEDDWTFNALWSFHLAGGHFAMADASVRMITYAAGNRPFGSSTLLETLASRNGQEPVTLDD